MSGGSGLRRSAAGSSDTPQGAAPKVRARACHHKINNTPPQPAGEPELRHRRLDNTYSQLTQAQTTNAWACESTGGDVGARGFGGELRPADLAGLS
jgi:hypothetical protein